MKNSKSPRAGQLPQPEDLISVSKLLGAYEAKQPDPSVPAQRVHFGTSGHRGTSLASSFNRDHVLAMTQAICFYRKKNSITGPLFLGFDSHALSRPAFETTLEVLAANDVITVIAQNQEFTPTPVISHAILCHNKGRDDAKGSFADGIVITPSHNPPDSGGFKYNPMHGGPAEKEITDWIQNRANVLLESGLLAVKRLPYKTALAASTTHAMDLITPYVSDLATVLDMDLLCDSKIKMAVDPLGGAGVRYWQPIADRYKLNLTVLNTTVDPTFRFMPLDWDGKIRMDPSSAFAMKALIEKGHGYDVTFACDTDHDRHGIVTPSSGLLPPNHFLAASIFYLFKHRPLWPSSLQAGKTLVSSQMIDRVAESLDRKVYEVPVGFKYFVDGLLKSKLGFAGEESAGATFLRKDASVWTTDKDGLIPALLAGEMTARLGKDPGEIYKDLTTSLGSPVYGRIEAPADANQRLTIGQLSEKDVDATVIGGEVIEKILTKAPGDGASISGVKIETKNGWIAVRPSGTEDIYKIYGESFRDQSHLDLLLADGQKIVDELMTRGS